MTRHKRFKKEVMVEENGKDDDNYSDVADMLEDDELVYPRFLKSEELIRGSKRKCPAPLKEEMYEKVPRSMAKNQKERRWLLPVKSTNGLIFRDEEVKDEEVKGDLSSLFQDSSVKEHTIQKPESLAKTLAQRLKLKQETKAKIGVYCTLIVENPENNMDHLKELTLLLREKDPTANLVIAKLTMLSLLEVYNDILPSYKIRTLGGEEKVQKMKKETRKLNRFEESLLRYYKQYLQFLENTVRTAFKLKFASSSDVYIERKRKMGLVAVKCLCQLLITRADFNFGTNIVQVIVPLTAGENNHVSEVCCQAICQVFQEDKRGETSLAIVKCIVQLVKSKRNLRPEVLRTFLNLNLIKVGMEERSTKNAKKMRERLARMSRKERKREKKTKELEQELRETEAEENKSERARINSEILNLVFLIYFRVLKKSTGSRLLTPVLEGLSKFAHLINVEFFDDLMNELHVLPDRVHLNNNETMHCLHAVFVVLSGQGSVLNIDPQRFFVQLYRTLLCMHVGSCEEDFEILWKCLEVGILKRHRSDPTGRILAFIKRLCATGLQTSGHGTVALLSAVRYLMASVSKSDILLDIEEAGGSGVFLPKLEDPEHCNAHATVLWELHYLSQHYHPAARRFARHLLAGCPSKGTGRLEPELIKAKSSELYNQYQYPEWKKEEKIIRNGPKSVKLNPEFLNSCLNVAHEINKPS